MRYFLISAFTRRRTTYLLHSNLMYQNIIETVLKHDVIKSRKKMVKQGHNRKKRIKPLFHEKLHSLPKIKIKIPWFVCLSLCSLGVKWCQNLELSCSFFFWVIIKLLEGSLHTFNDLFCVHTTTPPPCSAISQNSTLNLDTSKKKVELEIFE